MAELTGCWVYVLMLDNGRHYIGSTANLVGRVDQHLSGKGSLATKRNRPLKVVSVYPCKSRQQAYTVECYLQYVQRHSHNWRPPHCSNASELVELILQAVEYKMKKWEQREWIRTQLQGTRNK